MFLPQGYHKLALVFNQDLDLNGICKLLAFVLACMVLGIASTIMCLPAPKFSLLFLSLHCFGEGNSFALLNFFKCINIFMKVSDSNMGSLEHLEFVPSLFLTNLFNTPAFISASALKAWKDTVLGTAFKIYRVENVQVICHRLDIIFLILRGKKWLFHCIYP